MRPITASDLMNPEVLTVGEELTVEQLAQFLISNEISGAPVRGVDGRLVGVVSLHDIVSYLIDDEPGDADEEIAEALTTPADRADTGAEESRAEKTGVPETAPPDPDGSAAGAAPPDAEEDLDLMGDELLVEDIMTPKVVSVSEDATVPEIASLMLKEHLHRLLVMDGDEAKGILSTSDLLGLLVEEE